MEAAGPVKEQAAQVVQEVKENLQEPAQEAVENVKQSASQAATGGGRRGPVGGAAGRGRGEGLGGQRPAGRFVELMSGERRPGVPGVEADKPTEIPAAGWWQVIRRAWAEAKADQVPLLAAGVAFFGFLSLFPAVVAAVLAYGLVADPAQIRDQAKELTAAMPASGRDLLLQQLDALTSAPRQGLGIGVAIAVVAALWSASGGVGYLLTAVNLAYDEDETRGFVRRKSLALGMTLGRDRVRAARDRPVRGRGGDRQRRRRHRSGSCWRWHGWCSRSC